MKSMNIEKALEVFHDEIIYLQNKDYPEWMVKKKADAYNCICDYISSVEMDSEEKEYQLNQKIKKLELIKAKLEGLLLAIGIKFNYLLMLDFLPLNHISFLVQKSIDLGYSNSFIPDDIYMGHFSKKHEKLQKNLDYFIQKKLIATKNQIKGLEKIS